MSFQFKMVMLKMGHKFMEDIFLAIEYLHNASELIRLSNP